jgi:hypothetical protein
MLQKHFSGNVNFRWIQKEDFDSEEENVVEEEIVNSVKGCVLWSFWKWYVAQKKMCSYAEKWKAFLIQTVPFYGP